MRKYFELFFLVFMAMGAGAQSASTPRFSFDIGATNFYSDSSVNDTIAAFNNPDIESYKVREIVTSPHLGLNLHYKKWAFGIGMQSEHSSEVEINRNQSPHVDLAGTSNSWWSAYAERRTQIGNNFDSFVALGATHSKVRGFVRSTGQISRVRFNETDPFIRLGVSRQFKKVQTRIDVTRRFTDTDLNNLVRVTVRSSFG